MSLDDLLESLAKKPPHPLDPFLNEMQRRAYTAQEKDGLLARTLTINSP